MDAFRRVSNSPEAGGSDVRNRNRTRKLYGETDRDKFAVNVRQQRAHKTEQGTWKCPVCDEESHAVSDPSLVTVQSFPCDQCGQNFRRRTQQRNHLSPVNRPYIDRFQNIDPEAQAHGPPKELDPSNPIQHWYLFTDGSGGTQGTAGWGVGIFDTVNPNITNEWLAALYGPVLTQSWDPLWGSM